MKKNMGSTDQIVRVLIAVVVAALFFTNVISGVLGIVLLAVAGIFVLTSVVSFCPIYAVLGLSSCPVDTK
ncbi:MAG: DUF2892 domain-containing protein [Saprospiraceae bacterium]|nr:DUF2892 domain-containing protein [Saprospiraceae bacterium]